MPGVVPAVYSPLEEILPPVAVHVTALLVVPVTVAVNCCTPIPASSVANVGEIDTVIGGAVIVTVAEAALVLSATLVALTV